MGSRGQNFDIGGLPKIVGNGRYFEAWYKSEEEAIKTAYDTRADYIKRLRKAEKMLDGALAVRDRDPAAFKKYADEGRSLMLSLAADHGQDMLPDEIQRRAKKIVLQKYPKFPEWQKRVKAGENVPEIKKAMKNMGNLLNEAKKSILKGYARENLKNNSLDFWSRSMKARADTYYRHINRR